MQACLKQDKSDCKHPSQLQHLSPQVLGDDQPCPQHTAARPMHHAAAPRTRGACLDMSQQLLQRCLLALQDLKLQQHARSISTGNLARPLGARNKPLR